MHRSSSWIRALAIMASLRTMVCLATLNLAAEQPKGLGFRVYKGL